MKLTICGSIAFYTEMESLRDELAALGHAVKIPELKDEAPEELGGDKKVYFGKYIEDNGGINAFPAGHTIWDHKENAILTHYDKIDWCDAIVVANYDKRGIEGYIGGNTLIEIGVAFYQKKPIYILNPVSSSLSYKVEILGMKPIMLRGNLRAVE